LRYSGQRITQVVLTLTLGEYLTLLNDTLHQRTGELLASIDQRFNKPAANKVRAMVLSGALSIASARNNRTLIDISVWTLESTESLLARLSQLRASGDFGRGEALRSIHIGAASLQDSAERVTQSMSIGAAEARQMATQALRGMRDNAGNTLLVLGSLWFVQDSLRNNLKALSRTAGSSHDEALAAVWSSSVGVMGVGVEAAGVALKALRPGITTTVGGFIKPLGDRVMQYGGAIAAVAGIMDGVQFGLAANRAAHQGDSSASRKYLAAGVASGLSAYFGVAGAVTLNAALLGPLGIAIVLGLTAYAFATLAKKAESTALELWARHSLWGLPRQHRQWTTAEHYDTAVAALNAAVLGLTAEVGIHTRIRPLGGNRTIGIGASVGTDVQWASYLRYAIQLPGFVPGESRYEWALTVYRPHTAEQVIACGRSDSTPSLQPAPLPSQNDYDHDSTLPQLELDEESSTLLIRGSIELDTFYDINAAQLTVSFWPDRSDEAGHAHLIIKEDKMDIANRDRKDGN
ncbi:hypothetical protein GUY40_15085, partial [Pseudomonas sp. R5(2019)]|nr:hypothetical protein [Pseudomonas sp. R5(2019)]